MIGLLLAAWLAFLGPEGLEGAPGPDGSAGTGGAARAYAEGRFDDAYAAFEALLDSPDVDPAAVLYNLGNCAYRARRYVDAIVLYRRSLLRRPYDAATTHNVAQAERRLGIAPPPAHGLVAVAGAWIERRPRGTLLLSLVAIEAVGLALLVGPRPGRTRRGAAALLLLIGVAGGAWLIRAVASPPPRSAVVIAELVAIRPEPHRSLPVRLELAAGETVTVEGASDRWLRVTHPRGGGWVEPSGLVLVDEDRRRR